MDAPSTCGASPRGVEFLGPKQIREMAEHLGVVPTKKFGQNFLHDSNTVRMIVDAAVINDTDTVLEIGSGLGSLTLGLLASPAHRVIAVEIDKRLADELPHTVASYAPAHRERLHVHQGNALTLSRSDLPAAPTVLAANLPYNVAVPVVLHILAEFPTLRRVLVMVQTEVAERLAAHPGSKTYGVPSVKASYYGQVRRAGAVGAQVFWPVPKVASGLVSIDCYDRTIMSWDAPADEVFPLIDAAFAQRRKMLRAALSGVMGGAEVACSVLEAAGIDPRLRGERLAIADFVSLAVARRDLEMKRVQ